MEAKEREPDAQSNGVKRTNGMREDKQTLLKASNTWKVRETASQEPRGRMASKVS